MNSNVVVQAAGIIGRGDKAVIKPLADSAADGAPLWDTLVNRLIDSGYAACVDWKLDADSILYHLSLVAQKIDVSVSLGAIELDDTIATDEALVLISESLWEQGYGLGNIDTDSDSYTLFIQESNMTKELERLGGMMPYGKKRISFDASEW